jgi:hypothetical protein
MRESYNTAGEKIILPRYGKYPVKSASTFEEYFGSTAYSGDPRRPRKDSLQGCREGNSAQQSKGTPSYDGHYHAVVVLIEDLPATIISRLMHVEIR